MCAPAVEKKQRPHAEINIFKKRSKHDIQNWYVRTKHSPQLCKPCLHFLLENTVTEQTDSLKSMAILYFDFSSQGRNRLIRANIEINQPIHLQKRHWAVSEISAMLHMRPPHHPICCVASTMRARSTMLLHPTPPSVASTMRARSKLQVQGTSSAQPHPTP